MKIEVVGTYRDFGNLRFLPSMAALIYGITMKVERVYKENETFRFFRERDLIFDG